MIVKENENGEVKWQWCKKEFKNKETELKLDSPGYILLKDFGSSKFLAFKRPLFENEEVLPEDIIPIMSIDEEDLRKIRVFESRSDNRENVSAPSLETMAMVRETLTKKGFSFKN